MHQALTLQNARDLHDSIKRDVYTLGLILEILAKTPPPPLPPPPPAPAPTNAALVDEDRDNLKGWFFANGDFIGQDTLRMVAIHHTADQLIALGLIEPTKLGRYLYGYRSAGEIRQQLDLVTT